MSGHVSAPRAQVYRALIDPDAIARWRVPDGMTSQVHQFDPREGGTFRVSLTYTDSSERDAPQGKSGAHTDTYHGHFAQLVPDERVVEIIQFESAEDDLGSAMTMTTVLLDATGGGTDVTISHDGIPDAVPRADNEAGTQMALANLARIVEDSGRSA